MLNWKDSRSGHDQDVRVQINPGTFRAVDDDLITEQLFASARALLHPVLFQQAGLALPSGEVISLQPGPASNGLVIAGPTFPHWLTPSQECSFHLDRQALHDILSERHYEGVTPVVALFVDMSGKPYHSSPFDFDCALPCQWRMTEAQMRERMALEDKLHRASERV